MKLRKPFVIAGTALLALGATFLIPQSSVGQTAVDPNAAILKMVDQVTAQQAKLIANQIAMEQKLTSIEENVRIAKIYVSRGGGAAKK